MKNKINFKKYFKYGISFFLLIIVLLGVIIGTIVALQNSSNGIDDLIVKIVLSILGSILTLLLIVITPIFKIIIISLQNAIAILTLYPLLNNLFSFNYLTFILVTGTIFIVLLFIFTILSLFKNSNAEKNNFQWRNLLKAMILILIAPISMMLVLSVAQLLASLIFDIDNIYSFSIFDLLYKLSLGNESIDWGDGVLINLSETFFKDLLFILGGGFIIYFLFYFGVGLGTRIFELIIIGIGGILVASSSGVYDNGERFKLWTSIMLQKILIPIISIIGYVLFLSLMPEIIKTVEDIGGNWFVLGHEFESKAIIELMLLMGGSMLLKSLSTEWAFMIAGENGKSAFATQMNTVMGQMGQMNGPAKFLSGMITPFNISKGKGLGSILSFNLSKSRSLQLNKNNNKNKENDLKKDNNGETKKQISLETKTLSKIELRKRKDKNKK